MDDITRYGVRIAKAMYSKGHQLPTDSDLWKSVAKELTTEERSFFELDKAKTDQPADENVPDEPEIPEEPKDDLKPTEKSDESDNEKKWACIQRALRRRKMKKEIRKSVKQIKKELIMRSIRKDVRELKKAVGPGGHIADGTGPHGIGKGPGKGKQDGSGIASKEKSRIYISSPNEAPEGVAVERGSKGGLYYETGRRGPKTSPDMAPDEIAGKLIENRQNIGKPKYNYNLGKAGENLLSSYLPNMKLHTEWSSPFDLSNGELVEAKTSGKGKAILNRRARERKIKAAGKRQDDIYIYLLWVKEDRIELYKQKPEEKFFDVSKDDVYRIEANENELVATYTKDGGWKA